MYSINRELYYVQLYLIFFMSGTGERGVSMGGKSILFATNVCLFKGMVMYIFHFNIC